MLYVEGRRVSQSRQTFLNAIAAGAALLGIGSAAKPASAGIDRDRLYLAAPQPDIDKKPMFHGFPDECYAYTVFADSLVALAWGYGWYHQPPMVGARNAIVVDFASATEGGAEASIPHGWNGPAEFPMGVVGTVKSREAVTRQTDRVERHLSLIATGMRHDGFHDAVISRLLDRRTCPLADCPRCADRDPRRLVDVFGILADGADQCAVQLFSRWIPSDALRAELAALDIGIEHHPLSAIPAADLEANRYYHVWDGTPLQAEAFRNTVWAPAWKKALDSGA